MAKRLECPKRHGGTTDHIEEILSLRRRAKRKERYDQLVYLVAAELLAAHDESGISLDTWKNARDLVELLIGAGIVESGI